MWLNLPLVILTLLADCRVRVGIVCGSKFTCQMSTLTVKFDNWNPHSNDSYSTADVSNVREVTDISRLVGARKVYMTRLSFRVF